MSRDLFTVEQRLVANGVEPLAASRLRGIDRYLVAGGSGSSNFLTAAADFLSALSPERADRSVDILVGGSANESLHTVSRIIRASKRRVGAANLVDDLILMHGQAPEWLKEERAEKMGVDPVRFDFADEVRRRWARALIAGTRETIEAGPAVMSPEDFRSAQRALDLSDADLARVLGFDHAQHIRRLKAPADAAHHRPVKDYTARLLRAYLDGYRPPDWPVSDPIAPQD